MLVTGKLAWHANWYASSLQHYLVYLGVGIIAGLAGPLCALAQGSARLQANSSTLVAGAAISVLSAAAVAIGKGLTDDDSGWAFTRVSLAMITFGGALAASSWMPGQGGGGFRFRWKRAGLLMIIGLCVYACGAVMNLMHHFMPHTFSFDNFPPRPGPGFLIMTAVRFGHVMVLKVLAPTMIPVTLPEGFPRRVMKTYGVLFAAASVVLLAGFSAIMIQSISEAPGFSPSNPTVAQPFILMQRWNPVLMDTILVFTGVCLRLGFSRSPVIRAE